MSSRRKSPVWKKVVLGGFYALLLAFLLMGATLAGWIGRSEAVRGVLQGMMGEKPQSVFRQDSVTLLLLGCDEHRVFGKGVVTKAARSDVMMLVKLDFANKAVSALSIPRDIRVRPDRLGIHLPDISHLKLNGFHAHGGPELSQKAIQNLLDITIDRTIVVDYKAFQELVDQVGGVEVFIEKPMKYEDKAGELFIDLEKGRQRLNGYQAMGFVRYRKGNGESDFTRQERQKALLFGLKDEVLARPTLIPGVADKAVEVLDRKLTGTELGSIIWFSSKVQSSGIKMGALPVIERPTRSLYYQELNARKARATLIEYGFIESKSAKAQKEDSA
jgi:polyisoprenyl-teichoic acid--peptidoglycan teichoic acid transferase